ncbi:MAG: aminotransferase class IV [Pseudomonadota bacterium]
MARALTHAWFNGTAMPLAQVSVSPLDRGYLFGDGVYEVIPVYDGRALGVDQHVRRLRASLAAIRLSLDITDAALYTAFNDVVAANGEGDMSLYIQVSRAGDDGRDHRFPAAVDANVFIMACALTPASARVYANGISAVTMNDERWLRCDIKATSLLANVLARQTADASDAAEAILTRNGQLVEGATSAIGCVFDGDVSLPPHSRLLLPSITRELMIECARRSGITVNETPVSVDAMRGAREILLMSSTREIAPVVTLDNEPVGTGKPGPVWAALFNAYQQLKQH